MPILDSLSQWLLLFIETKKAGLSEIVNESNIKIQQAVNAAAEEEVPHMNTIGFVVPDDEYDEEEEDEDDL